MEKERYKTIDDYPNYEVSNLGNVRRKKDLKQITPSIKKGGYRVVHLSNDSGSKVLKVCRLVASAFLSSFAEDKFVKHINSQKDDDSVDNLFCISNPVNAGDYRVLNVDTGQVYNSVSEAAREIGCSRQNVYNTLDCIQTSCCGFKLRWYGEEDY